METENAQIRLMEAVRYALRHGGTRRDCEQLVAAVFAETEFVRPTPAKQFRAQPSYAWVPYGDRMRRVRVKDAVAMLEP